MLLLKHSPKNATNSRTADSQQKFCLVFLSFANAIGYSFLFTQGVQDEQILC